ncbi:MAG: helix-turn-helix domain-containing protein [Candidatus Woesearchaeota archaeon]
MTKYYIVKEQDGALFYDSILITKGPSAISIISQDIRQKILRILSKEPMYPAQLAKELKMHEQKVYYHIKQLLNADALEVVEKKEIRGTIAKRFKPKDINFAFILSNEWKPFNKLINQDKENKLVRFFAPFIANGLFNAKIVVGSPDPHGPHKARARDGHYAVDLALFIGAYASLSKAFVTSLDVDIDLKRDECNLIVIGGPITNLIMNKINDFLPAKFSDGEPWGITSLKKTYTDDSTGIIALIPNPYHPDYTILAIAGIRYSGTKAAILALTRHSNMVLNRYTGQKEFYCIVQGFDLDGDGKVDSIEVME